jgi:hypothetical protein
MPACAAITENSPTVTLCAILHQVIDFARPLDDGATESRAIHSGIGADFDIIFDHHDPVCGILTRPLPFCRHTRSRHCQSQHQHAK